MFLLIVITFSVLCTACFVSSAPDTKFNSKVSWRREQSNNPISLVVGQEFFEQDWVPPPDALEKIGDLLLKH